jgi:type II secretory pathway component PulM
MNAEQIPAEHVPAGQADGSGWRAGWTRGRARLERRWVALPPAVRDPRHLKLAGLAMSLVLLLAFWLTVQRAVERAEARQDQADMVQPSAEGETARKSAAG